MNSYRLVLPFSYFLQTRLKSRADFLFHAYIEWIPAMLVLFVLGKFSVIESITHFLVGYGAFISVYEIGYLVNDFFYTRGEVNPRKRLSGYSISGTFIFLFIALRACVFGGLVFAFQLSTDFFWAFYAALVVSFAIHNSLRSQEMKVASFIALASLRFLAPFCFFVPAEFITPLIPSVFLFYVFTRALAYMDSKALLNMEGRKNPAFKLTYYAILLPLAGVLCLAQTSWLPLIANLYYGIIWVPAVFYSRSTTRRI